jgi:hypothetical protein
VQRLKKILIDERIAAVLAILATVAFFVFIIWVATATGLADLGIRPDVIELAVNHRSGLRGGIAGVYNKSELLPERRAALERWAAHVEDLVTGKPTKMRGRDTRG